MKVQICLYCDSPHTLHDRVLKLDHIPRIGEEIIYRSFYLLDKDGEEAMVRGKILNIVNDLQNKLVEIYIQPDDHLHTTLERHDMLMEKINNRYKNG